MDARALIATLRDGKVPADGALNGFAEGLASGAVTDAQAGAFAMAVFLNGLRVEDRVELTLAMTDSGERLDWSGLPGPAIDKHSTGGVGDCVSLLLAPMLAAAGSYVPMISGRGLGHTGGTLDKLEAIPGLSTEQPRETFRQMVRDIGCGIVAASPDLAPADRRLYAIRDVTGTVESIDLITASILSKKLAAGLDALILDVKVGSGAFMATEERAEALARSLVTTANGAGCRTAALLTDMNQPLATSAGNALEVAEVMRILTGDAAAADGRLVEITLRLCADLMVLAGLEAHIAAAEAKLARTLSSGDAAERFLRMVRALGGPADFDRRWREQLPCAKVVRDVPAPSAGYVAAIDTRALGEAVVHLGGGRLRGGEAIDPSVGLSRIIALGDRVEAGAPVAQVHAANEAAAERAERAVIAALQLKDSPVPAPPLVLGEVR